VLEDAFDLELVQVPPDLLLVFVESGGFDIRLLNFIPVLGRFWI